MNFISARQKNYNVFSDCESESHDKKMQEMLRYIENIATMTTQDISEWDFTSVFSNHNSKKGFIHVDKNKINECFFSHLDKLQNPDKLDNVAVEVKKKIPDRLISALMSVDKELSLQKKISIERDLNHTRDCVKRSTLDLDKYNRVALRLNEEWRNFKPTLLNLVDQVQKVLTNDLIELSGDVGSSHITFITKDIILTYKNAKQAIDMTVPMGTFGIRIYFREGNFSHVKVIQMDRNIMVGSTYHPHVSVEGEVCFGNMYLEYENAVMSKNISGAVDVVMKCLTNYNPDNPYEHLYQFRDLYASSVAKVKNGENINDEEYGDDEAEEADVQPSIADAPMTSSHVANPNVGSSDYQIIFDQARRGQWNNLSDNPFISQAQQAGMQNVPGRPGIVMSPVTLEDANRNYSIAINRMRGDGFFGLGPGPILGPTNDESGDTNV